ncbi:hypothetical protein U1Q18_034595 [Sarracenia purpurea var. burkii]
MEASTGPPRLPTPPTEPNMEKIKQNLLQKGVYPTPKILHTLRKKQLQKSLRKSKRRLAAQPQPFTHSQNQSIAEESRFRTLKAEYKAFSKTITAKTKADSGPAMVGKPWERLESVQLRDFGGLSKEFGGQKLKSENLRELSEILERECDKFRWILDDDIELEDGWLENRRRNWDPQKRRGDEAEVIRFLVDKLSGANLSTKDWKLSKMMKKSGLQFTEGQLLKIVEGLGDKGQWRQASSVVEWVYSSKEHRHYKSR